MMIILYTILMEIPFMYSYGDMFLKSYTNVVFKTVLCLICFCDIFINFFTGIVGDTGSSITLHHGVIVGYVIFIDLLETLYIYTVQNSLLSSFH